MIRTVLLLSCAMAIRSAAWAGEVSTDTFSGTNRTNHGVNAYKLNTFTVTAPRILRSVAFYFGADTDEQARFVVYRQDGTDADTWHLAWAGDPQTLAVGLEFTASADIGLPLEVGARYAMGVYLLDDDVQYFWNDAIGAEAVAWGSRDGSLYSQNGSTASVLDPIVQWEGTNGYHMQVTVETIDEDGDGYDVVVDCDDDDEDVHPGAEEVCDGKDDDCDGLLGEGEDVDEDGDGSSACADCDDEDASTYPGAEEDPCGGVDRDCDGHVPDEADCAAAEDTADGITGAKGCACGGGASGSPSGLIALLAALAVRSGRRRGR